MGYKTTTDIYALRAEHTLAVNNSSAEQSGAIEIETNLDTLSREVLLIWEIDINPPTLGTQIGDCMASAGATESFTYHAYVSKQNSETQLDDAEYVGGFRNNVCHPANATNVVLASNWNPDTRSFMGGSKKESPLGIVVGDKIYFRQGYQRDTTAKTADSLVAQVRMMVQRAKADSETYAALLVGYSL